VQIALGGMIGQGVIVHTTMANTATAENIALFIMKAGFHAPIVAPLVVAG